ncbi:serine hydrolase domain-containing protein [Microvirga lenta]|uniref:serine hydrolase domain-containing protein n=1 Tax=Microvirga lenta TaxID=2881337 RepID=UPI001CFCD6A1|nr:serine hydrolase [Microvirga lenta]MCB5174289.1 beta-lactamase family protein [Microvirga lenta]
MSLTHLIEQAFAPAAAAIGDGNIPGAALGLVTADGARAVHWQGAAQIEPERQPMARETVFDLASLTKVIFTTTRILHLVEQGRIGLDDPLTTAIPDLRQYDMNAAERCLTFRQCLAHQTHLPAVEPLYTYGQDPNTLRAFILQRVWRSGPPVYSDINFMLLGIAIERITGEPLIEQPLPAGFTFRPDPSQCAATERCTWRGRVIRGEVHDENAFALGGASGHAGLFGTIDAVLDFALSVLDGSDLSAQSLKAIRTRESEKRTVGWEGFYAGWHGGDACSPATIGHTGFTGTGLWIDFDRKMAWSLLTNRVHPSRHKDSGIVALRRATGEQVVTLFDARVRS